MIRSRLRELPPELRSLKMMESERSAHLYLIAMQNSPSGCMLSLKKCTVDATFVSSDVLICWLYRATLDNLGLGEAVIPAISTMYVVFTSYASYSKAYVTLSNPNHKYKPISPSSSREVILITSKCR
jgi:hypothetical protein